MNGKYRRFEGLAFGVYPHLNIDEIYEHSTQYFDFYESQNIPIQIFQLSTQFIWAPFGFTESEICESKSRFSDDALAVSKFVLPVGEYRPPKVYF